MHAQLNYVIVRQRSVVLPPAGERPRRASEVPARRRGLPEPNPIAPAGAEPGRARTGFAAGRTIGGVR
ncbi:MAG: hypothetical protein JO046_09215 [Solirubrobacterales bacterium]|nr:hypothetical protein [Solirubrobacterales bacterium]